MICPRVSNRSRGQASRDQWQMPASCRPESAIWQSCWLFRSATEVHPLWALPVSVPQHVLSVAHVPVGLPPPELLVPPELLAVPELLPELDAVPELEPLPELLPLLQLEAQFDWRQLEKLESADVQLDSLALLAQDDALPPALHEQLM